MREYTNSEIANAINEYIHSKRDREILYLRLVDGLTYEQIAEYKEMSVRQVKNIVYRAQERLFDKL